MMNRYLSLEGAIGAELQASLTPADAIALLKDGVKRSAIRASHPNLGTTTHPKLISLIIGVKNMGIEC